MMDLSTIGAWQKVHNELLVVIPPNAKQLYSFKANVATQATRIYVAFQSNDDCLVILSDDGIDYRKSTGHGTQSFLYDAKQNTLTYWGEPTSVQPKTVDRANMIAAAVGRALDTQVNIVPKVS